MSNRKKHILTLLDNNAFVKWLLFPIEGLYSYWDKEIKKDPEMEKEIKNIRKIIKRLNIKEPSLLSADKNIIWQKISQNTFRKHKKNKKSSFIWITSLAASVALIGLAYFFYQNISSEIDYSAYVDVHAVKKGGDVELVLSDHKIVKIDEDSVEFVYDKQGNVSVNNNRIIDESPTEMNKLIVPYGKSASLTLSDGSKVHVNSGSTLVYPKLFDKKHREVYVEGEIYLDVVHDQNIPFMVKTSQLEISVKGTSFNVNAYSDMENQSVVLVEGAVAVKGNAMKKTLDITPSQKFLYNKESKEGSVSLVDVNDYISWTHGFLGFRSSSLTDVLQKLNRYYNVKITYDINQLEQIKVTGKLDLRKGVKEALEYISLTAPIKYTFQDEDNIIITSK